MKTASGVSAITREKSITQRVASNFGWSLVSEAVGKGVFFFTNIYLARTLSVGNFGLLSLAQFVILYLWFAVDLGSGMYGIREIAKDKKNAVEIINSLLTLRVTMGIIVSVAYVVVLLLLNMPLSKLLVFLGCGFHLISYSLYTDWVLKGLEKFNFIAFGNLVSSAFFLVLAVFLVRDPRDIVVASFIWGLYYLAGSLSLLYLLSKRIGLKLYPSFGIKKWRYHVRESIYIVMAGSMLLLYQYLPIVFLRLFFSVYEVGLFAAPFRVITIMGSAGLMLPMAFYPVLSDLYTRDKIKFRRVHIRSQLLMLAIGLPVGIIGMLWGSEILLYVFGNKYIEGLRIVKYLVWLVPLYFTRFTYGTVLVATGFQRYSVIATFVGVLSMVILGFIMVPRFGLMGASLALLLSEVTIITVMAFVFHSKILLV